MRISRLTRGVGGRLDGRIGGTHYEINIILIIIYGIRNI